MNRRANAAAKGMTLIEFLVVVTIIGLLVALVLPLGSGPRKSKTVACMMNLRVLGCDMLSFAQEHNDFPSHVALTNGGTLGLASSNSSAAYFRALRSVGNPNLLVCPTDKAKTPATNYQTLSDANVSYFMSLDATPALTNAFLAGDRNLEVGGKAVPSGRWPLTTNLALSWTRELHSAGERCGMVLFADAHVERLRTNVVDRARTQGLGTNWLLFP
jgi:prepilin-type N-terminal cleavage/methylation domain-containing protein/prepilin-type processing-associated H-X9-DG protein